MATAHCNRIPAMATAYIGLGSNLGDRAANLESAIAALAATDGIDVVARSMVRETEPLEAPPPRYLNAVVAVETRLSPRDLLARCQQLEAALGRTRPYPHAPRTIDLDILLHGSVVMDTPDLVLPHPGLTRPFVLAPLLEIAPDLRHPVTGQPLQQR
jgi:2-amino-4-hydroxy-6-hydroxymethyldihydropteridine diphosphokinase